MASNSYFGLVTYLGFLFSGRKVCSIAKVIGVTSKKSNFVFLIHQRIGVRALDISINIEGFGGFGSCGSLI